MKGRTMRILIAAALLLAGGCASSSAPKASPAPAAKRPASAATLSFVEPQAGATVTGTQVHVKLDLQGGRIVPQTSTTLKPDEGHLHLYLDDALISMNYQVEQDVPGLTKGTHLLRAEFVASDHAPFSPRVITAVTITVG